MLHLTIFSLKKSSAKQKNDKRTSINVPKANVIANSNKDDRSDVEHDVDNDDKNVT